MNTVHVMWMNKYKVFIFCLKGIALISSYHLVKLLLGSFRENARAKEIMSEEAHPTCVTDK